jgi:hypothetical protein
VPIPGESEHTSFKNRGPSNGPQDMKWIFCKQ